jgi:hypothetical protein
MRRATLFILSDVRSGSTLLDQCLGGNPRIASLGEVHWLAAYVTQDRSQYDPEHPLVCACGLPVPDCPFWTEVSRELGRPLTSLRSRQGLKRESHEGFLTIATRHVPRRLIKTRPWIYRSPLVRALFDGSRLGKDCIDLYDAVSKVSGKPVCTDSSKSAFRFRDVYQLDPHRTYAIVLARDYRAVVYSKMKRGATLESAALGWRRAMEQCDALTRDLPARNVLRMTYEHFCEEPRTTLERICRFLDVEFAESMLGRSTGDSHHIGGSPTKFEPGRSTISLDRSYERQFEARDLQRLGAIVGKTAGAWGY